MTHLSPEETARVIELSMHASPEGMTEELVGFVDHGLPVDVQDEDGNTPLMLAAYHGHLETVRMLVERCRPRPVQQPRPGADGRRAVQG